MRDTCQFGCATRLSLDARHVSPDRNHTQVKWTWKGSFLLFYYFELKVERTCTGKWASTEWRNICLMNDAIMNSEGNFFEKKKRRVRSAIAVSPDKVPFGGIINEEHWPGASFWRQGWMVLVGDSSYKISQIIPTISSINSGSRLHPQLFYYYYYFFFL